MQGSKDLFTMHIDFPGGDDTKSHLIPAHFEHGHDYIVADHDALVRSPREDQHTPSLVGGEYTTRWCRSRGTRAERD